jgi:hypothetical protein
MGTAGLERPRAPVFGPDDDLYVTVTGKNEIMRFGTANEAVVTVGLSAPSSNVVTVEFSTADSTAEAGTDYLASGGTLTFTPGSTIRTILIPIVGDAIEENPEEFTVNLSSASGALIHDAQGVVTVNDDDGSSTAPNAVYVYDIRFESERRDRDWRAVFEIRTDSNNSGTGDPGDQPLAGVTITVEFAGRTFTGVTDADGVFRTDLIRNVGSGDRFAEVVDLALTDYFWDPLTLDLEGDSDGDGLPDNVPT